MAHMTRILVVSFASLVVSAAVPEVQAQDVVPKVRSVFSFNQIGLKYSVRGANWGNYLFVEQTQPGLGAALAGLEPGDLISRVNNFRVMNGATLRGAVDASPDVARFQVFDVRTNQWKRINVQVRQIGQPVPDNNAVPIPDPGNGGAGNGPNQNLAGIWQSSLGGTIQFFPGPPQGFLAAANVPLFGSSDMFCTRNFDGSFSFTYQQRNGARDHGSGLLRPQGLNRLTGYFINGLGVQVNFVLTR